MSQAPSMPMFWDAYIADTTHLTTEEHGAYLLLLAAMWRRNGWVPDDDADTARIVGMTKAKWRKTKERLASLLIFSDGHITQKNLMKIWKNTQEKIAINRANGAKGGRPQSNKDNDIAKADGFVPHNPNETIPEPEPEPKPDIKKETPNGVSKESDATTENHDGRTIRSGNAADTAAPGQPGSVPEADENGMDAGTGEVKPAADDALKPKPKRKRSATAKCGLDGNWEPDQSAIAYAEERGLDWQRTWEDFREYNLKHGKQWAGAKGWLAAWQGWCRRQNEFDAKQNSRNSRHGGQSRAGVAGQGDPENDPWHEALLARRAAGVGQFGEAIPVAGNGQPDGDGSEILFFGDYRSIGGS
jgi:uncharacterized protein YdaU (DUF1376 family)